MSLEIFITVFCPFVGIHKTDCVNKNASCKPTQERMIRGCQVVGDPGAYKGKEQKNESPFGLSIEKVSVSR